MAARPWIVALRPARCPDERVGRRRRRSRRSRRGSTRRRRARVVEIAGRAPIRGDLVHRPAPARSSAGAPAARSARATAASSASARPTSRSRASTSTAAAAATSGATPPASTSRRPRRHRPRLPRSATRCSASTCAAPTAPRRTLRDPRHSGQGRRARRAPASTSGTRTASRSIENDDRRRARRLLHPVVVARDGRAATARATCATGSTTCSPTTTSSRTTCSSAATPAPRSCTRSGSPSAATASSTTAGFASVGLLLKSCEDVMAEDNLIADNARGIFIEGVVSQHVPRERDRAVGRRADRLYDSSRANAVRGQLLRRQPDAAVARRPAHRHGLRRQLLVRQRRARTWTATAVTDRPYRLSSLFDHFRGNLTAADLFSRGPSRVGAGGRRARISGARSRSGRGRGAARAAARAAGPGRGRFARGETCRARADVGGVRLRGGCRAAPATPSPSPAAGRAGSRGMIRFTTSTKRFAPARWRWIG